jgi:uncharacterized protein
MFSLEVQEALKYYVYRLIDPRNGETFYVGKGKGNRIFDHVKGALKLEKGEDEVSAKLKIIREIINLDLAPISIIHRHNLSEQEAFLAEAVLIDAIPGLSNIVSGKYSFQYGPQNHKQLIEKYSCDSFPVNPKHKLILINIPKSINERDLYSAVRAAWIIAYKKAAEANFVLAINNNICREVYIPEQWLVATQTNFPFLKKDYLNRLGFVGKIASSDIQSQYKGKKLPHNLMSKKGARWPIKYSY